MTESIQPGARVLVIEDEEPLRDMLQVALEDAHCVVVTATNGAEGLRLFETFRPEIVLLDGMMPVMDGFETCRMIRATDYGATLPVLMITVLEDHDSIERAFDAGVSDYIQKPILLPLLERRILRLVAQRRAEAQVRESESRFRALADTAAVMIWMTDDAGAGTFFNRRWYEFVGATPETMPAYFWQARIVEDDVEQLRQTFAIALKTQTRFDLVYRMRRADDAIRWVQTSGVPRWTDDARFAGYVGTTIDITAHRELTQQLRDAKADLEQRVLQRTEEVRRVNERLVLELGERKRIQERLAHDVLHDALTGLTNRTLFLDRLSHAIDRSRRRDERRCAALFLDLDRFKVINDSLGHIVGDRLLVLVARRLEAALRPGDTVARLGGDEFAILLEGIDDWDNVTVVANRIQHELRTPFQISGHPVVTSASIGIALVTESYTTSEEVLRDADLAMYRAKSLGKARYAVFEPAMHAQALAHLQLEADLRHAVERQEFVLHYQPIVSLATGALIGVEALVRWLHPQLGLVKPGEFIHVAEETGLIVPLGEWVIRDVCFQLRAWNRQGLNDIFVAINLSARQFRDIDLVETIRHALQDTGIPAHLLQFEITESSLVEDAEATITLLYNLKSLGIHLSIDDFGIGYSSLNYLQRFPLTTLKIDRSFMSNVVRNPGDAGIVTAIIAMAHRLNLRVVAEGVEHDEQAEFLVLYNCDAVQGYLYSPPLPPDILLERFVKEQGCWIIRKPVQAS